MHETTPHETLDIQGTAKTYRVVTMGKLGLAVLLAIVGFGLSSAAGRGATFASMDSLELALSAWTFYGLAILVVASLGMSLDTHVYLDLTGREIVTSKHLAFWETSRRRRPLTEFGEIVVRHLCHPNPEGEDTYTGSVGLKPVDKGPVLWVKNFPTTQDEVPRDAYEFARKLQTMIGLPLADPAGFRDETR